MNTTQITTRLACATAVAALSLGAAACGTETATAPGSIEKAASEQQSRISPHNAEHRAEVEEQARRHRAEHADAERWAHGHTSTTSRPHPSGSQKFPDLHP